MGRSLLPPEEAVAAGFAAVQPLSQLEPDPQRSIAHAAELLSEVGARFAAEWLP